ncbi:hypothetical protein [Streptosporangium sp. KLBMP 9127]|nr:hypothetical protein [Streptosporangium sp. KLBMP 9127]
MKIMRKAAVAGAMGMAAMSIMVVPASATATATATASTSAVQYLTGVCSKGAYALRVTIRYGTSSTKHFFNQVSWQIVGDVGSKNTVRYYFVQEMSGADHVFKAYNYQGGKTGVRNIVLNRPKSHRVYVKFAAVFDKKGSATSSCTFKTRAI